MTETTHSCIKCEATHTSLINFQTYDTEMEAGVCKSCYQRDKPEYPSFRSQQRIRSIGTPEQKAKLELDLKVYNDYIEANAPSSEPYIANERPSEDYTVRPKEVTLKKVKEIYWYYYHGLVLKETGKKPDPFTEAEKSIHNNFVKWLIGDVGDYDPNKSLYIYGARGNGKSSMVLAGSYTLERIKALCEWDKYAYQFANMDELMTEATLNSEIKGLGKFLSGSWAIDEIREKHLQYKHFGTDQVIINDILAARHSKWKTTRRRTIITTNVPYNVMFDLMADNRLQDRMMQEYCFVLYDGVNRRPETVDLIK